MDIESKENYEVKKLTTFKIGGVVSKAYFPKTQQELIYLLSELDDYILLGNCSNILFSSNGYKGNVVFTSKLDECFIKGTTVVAQCGVCGQKLSKLAEEKGLSGFEFMIGFPGSIGGEIYMNASAHGQSIADTLVKACVFDKEKKEVCYIDKAELCFGYRYSILQDGRYILLGAEFCLKKGNKDDISALMKRNIESRKEVQPNLTNPNAGSVFRNPQNDSAGRLLEKAGGKMLSGNNTAIWKNHANFIVNTGNATSEDVLELMLKMYTAVKDNFTIELEPEIIFVGEKTDNEEKICKILYQKNQK